MAVILNEPRIESINLVVNKMLVGCSGTVAADLVGHNSLQLCVS